MAHFALHIPYVLRRQIGGAIGTLKHAMGDLFDTMYESTRGASVCLTLCPVCVSVHVTAHVNSEVFTLSDYSNDPIGNFGFVGVFVFQSVIVIVIQLYYRT